MKKTKNVDVDLMAALKTSLGIGPHKSNPSKLDKAVELLKIVKRRYQTGIFKSIEYNGKNIDTLPSQIDDFLKDVKHE